jgi:predicted DNA-binding protein (MmcQ/YjbR family)
MNIHNFSSTCLSFPDTLESPHFDNIAFKVKNKIFATINAKEMRATIKLELVDQDVFCRVSKGSIYPVPNKWGKHGWTHLNLSTIPEDLAIDAIETAYRTAARKKTLKDSNLPEE